MEFSTDRFLGGRIVARQPREGFRSGTDAVMLAAAVPAVSSDDILEMGCGVGIASLCVASRIPECRVTGIEIMPELTILAQQNVLANGMAGRVQFEPGDALNIPGHLRKSFEHVFCNPPFHHRDGEASPNVDRARALWDREGVGRWIKAGLARVVAGGTLTAILRADRMAEALQATPRDAVCAFPLWPRVGEPAKRIILQVRKNSNAPFLLAAGLVLHDNDGRYTPEADAVLRGAASLALATPRL